MKLRRTQKIVPFILGYPVMYLKYLVLTLFNLRSNLPIRLLCNITKRCWKMLSEWTSVGQHSVYVEPVRAPVVQNAPPSSRQQAGGGSESGNDWSAGALSMRVCYMPIIDDWFYRACWDRVYCLACIGARTAEGGTRLTRTGADESSPPCQPVAARLRHLVVVVSWQIS